MSVTAGTTALHRLRQTLARRAGPLLTACVLVAVAALGVLGHRAVSEWRDSATLLAQRQADAAANLLVTALAKDMRGVQMSLVGPAWNSPFHPEPLPDLGHRIAGLFARYPYPEAFFLSDAATGHATVFFTRRDRHPAWMPPPGDDERFPVVMGRHAGVSGALGERVARDATAGRRVSVFDISLYGTPYQVVATLGPTPPGSLSPTVVFGFLVNLDWVRRHYIPAVTAQVARMTEAPGVVLTIVDANGSALVGSSGVPAGTPFRDRAFAPFFFDPSLVLVDPPEDLSSAPWTARAVAVADPTLVAARQGAQRTLTLVIASTLLLVLGFGLTIRGARLNAQLAEMRATFVSTITHELKTPVATLRAIGENLATGRAASPQASQQFGRIAVQETTRLARLVENLLAYSRITDVTEAYTFERVSLAELVDDALREFTIPLARDAFALQVDIPPDLPPARGDRLALSLALSNVIDNAIRYSRGVHAITISARSDGGTVQLSVADRGIGIAPDALPHVTRKFYRVTGSPVPGNGLGLAIVDRVVTDHGGQLQIASAPGTGTTVTLHLPAARPAA